MILDSANTFGTRGNVTGYKSYQDSLNLNTLMGSITKYVVPLKYKLVEIDLTVILL